MRVSSNGPKPRGTEQSAGFGEHVPIIPEATPNIPLPSTRSVLPSYTGGNPDHVIIHPVNYVEIKFNNHHVEFDRINIHPVVKEVLRNHPLAYALTHTVNVPMLYLQQAWKTITPTMENRKSIFEIQIDEFITKLDYHRLRLVLRLPKPTFRPGKTAFDEYPSENEVFEGIKAMGYIGELNQVKDFYKGYLPPVYYAIFSVINRCLTSKHSGTDSASIGILKLFHAVVYDLHVDYVAIFWHELQEKVDERQKHKGKPYVPYMRFLQLIVHSMMRSNRDIPRRLNQPSVPEKSMRYLQQPKQSFDYEMPLPEGFLRYANQHAKCIVEYRESMVRPESEGPTKDSTPRKEASVRVQDARATEREAQRENSERGTCEGQISVSEDTWLSFQDTQLDDRVVQSTEELIPRHVGTVASTGALGPSDEETETDSDNASDSAEEQEDQGNNDDDDDHDGGNDDNAFGNVADIVTFPNMSTSADIEPEDINIDDLPEITHIDAETVASVLDATMGGIRRTEGDLFEDVSEPVRENEEKNDARVSETITHNFRRAATSTTRSHVLGLSVEKDVSSPLTHLHTQASHSASSQQEVVSFSHGVSAKLLSFSHSKSSGIEIERLPPRSSTFTSAQSLSLDPIAELLSSLTRTLSFFVTSDGSLSAPFGTLGVIPTIGLQRQSGSPTSANIMPTLNVGHTVESTVVTTDNLCGSGGDLPNFVSRKTFDGALKAVETSLMKEIQGVKYLLKGKGLMIDEPELPPPLPPVTPIPVPQPDQSIDELKNLLYAKLLSISLEDQQNKTLLSLLENFQPRPQPTLPTPNVVTSTEFNEFKSEVIQSLSDMKKAMDALTEQVSIMNQNCKSQAQGTKRRHDQDPDDHDHEGEISKKRRTNTETSRGEKTMSATETSRGEKTMSATEVFSLFESGAMGEESGKQIILYVDPNVEPTVEKPEVNE